MPRIDCEEALLVELTFVEKLPMNRPDFDLCIPCYDSFECEVEVVHPPYGEQPLPDFCAYCGCTLVKEDN